MKKLLSISLLIWLSFSLSAAYLTNIPKTLEQPDGTTISCFASGDEFYNYLHDADGYTIIQAEDGYFYYGKVQNGNVVPSSYRVGVVNPKSTNLKVGAKISVKNYLTKRADLDKYTTARVNSKAKDFSHINNVCIYIRFSDSEDFTDKQITVFDSVYNAEEQSLANFYKTVSFGKLTVKTYSLPKDESTEYRSFKDIYPIAYYRPYNKTSNPNGYSGDNERTKREHELLQRSIQWVDENTPLPSDLNIDDNEDGLVDNVSFIINENQTGWSDLLWAHRSSLSGQYPATLNGKSVSVFIFMPKDQADRNTICHEFFHALGAPDLYHYDDNYSYLTPAGAWDVMEYGFGEMSSHMKEKYGSWIDIPVIKSSGSFSLKPTLSDTAGIAYRFPIGDFESLVLEYRRKEGPYDRTIPGTGLLVFRVNSKYKGNAQYNGRFSLDEVYVFRPDGDLTKNGKVAEAHLSDLVGRTRITDYTNPKMYLSKGEETNVEIYNIEDRDTCLVFNLFIGPNFDPQNIYIYPKMDDMMLGWKKDLSADSILIIRSEETLKQSIIPTDGESYQLGALIGGKSKVVYNGTGTEFTDTDVEAGKTYYYTIFSKNDKLKYSKGVEVNATTIAKTVECNPLSNISKTDSLVAYTYSPWGSVSGHSGRQRSQFAEKFANNSLVGMINSININFITCVAASANSKITIWLADIDKDGKVGNKYYWQDVKISTLKVGENSIPLSTPVLAKKEFFVGYTIYYQPAGDTIAVNMAYTYENRVNTCYVYYNDRVGWENLTTLDAEISSSYAVGATICNGVGDSPTYFEIYPKELALGTKGTIAHLGVWSNLGLWTTANVPTWVSETKDYLNGELTFTAKEDNETSQPREAEITISVAGQTKTMKLIQSNGVGIEDNTTVSDIQVYPNPSATGIFELRTPSACQYQILDYTGKIIQSGNTSSSSTVLDISRYTSGMYFIKVIDGQKQSVLKLIK